MGDLTWFGWFLVGFITGGMLWGAWIYRTVMEAAEEWAEEWVRENRRKVQR